MKKIFQHSDWHVIDISTEKSMAELAAMPEKDLQKELESSGFYEKKVLYRASDEMVTRNIAGETILVPVGEQAKRLNGFATFTETGQFLWNLLSQKKCTEADLVLALFRECQIPKETIQADVKAYLEKMVENGFVIRCH